MGVLVKTNMRDGFKGGLEIDDCVTVAKELHQLGAHALVLSGGFVSKAPMYVMRGGMPIYWVTYYMEQLWMKSKPSSSSTLSAPSRSTTPPTYTSVPGISSRKRRASSRK